MRWLSHETLMWMGVASWVMQGAKVALIVVGCVWAKRRFGVPAAPWVLASFAVRLLLYFPARALALRALDQRIAAGNAITPNLSVGEVVQMAATVGGVAAGLAGALLVWIVLSELVHAQAPGAPSRAAALARIPRRYPVSFGVTLVACAFVDPAFWITVWLT